MRQLIATVFNYSLDGYIAAENSDFWEFCFDLPENREPDDPTQLDFLRGAHAHLMGRTAYEGMSRGMASGEHPFAPVLTAARKVVFSRTMTQADWANTTIATGDLRKEIDALRQGGEGHLIVWGGVGLWRSLMQHDLLDELRVSLFPYIAGEGVRVFDETTRSYALELMSNSGSPNGIVELQYRRRR